MHEDDGGAVLGDDLGHLFAESFFIFVGESFFRLDISSGGDVVDDLRAFFKRCGGDRRAVRVDGDRRVDCAAERLHDGNHAAQLFRLFDRIRAGARAFAPDVENRGPVAQRLLSRVDDRVKIDFERAVLRFAEPTAVGKTVGGDVEDRHYYRLCVVERRCAQTPGRKSTTHR